MRPLDWTYLFLAVVAMVLSVASIAFAVYALVTL